MQGAYYVASSTIRTHNNQHMTNTARQVTRQMDTSNESIVIDTASAAFAHRHAKPGAEVNSMNQTPK